MTKQPLQPIDEKNKGWARLMRCIIHDLTTPLATVRLASQSLENALPDVFKGYQLAVEHQLMEPVKNPAQLKFIQEKALPNIEFEVDKILKRIHAMSDYIQKFTLVAPEDVEILSMREVVQGIVKDYPFANEAERALVHVDAKQDFKFRGFSLFMKDLLSNLLDNALHHIRAAQKGEISIALEQQGEWNMLSFKDSGPGISAERLPEVFKRFFCTRDEKVTAGLGLCRHVILETGGSMHCDSKLGEYTQFVMKFPCLT